MKNIPHMVAIGYGLYAWLTGLALRLIQLWNESPLETILMGASAIYLLAYCVIAFAKVDTERANNWSKGYNEGAEAARKSMQES